MEELWDDYLEYLIWRGGLGRMPGYSLIFETLHHMNFTCLLDRDENREDDGVELREHYEIPDGYEVEIEEAFYARKCSVMEMMVALAIRVDDEYIGDPAEAHPEDFFMEMIENLGLDRFRGGRYQESAVIKIVQRWLDRRFTAHGLGSPFPVLNDWRDQRNLEIWDQMNSYVNENYR